MDKKTLVSELDRADIFRLVNMMKDSDDILYGLFDSIVGISFLPEHFTPVKATALFWGRVSELLGLPGNSSIDFPVIHPVDFYGTTGYERGVGDEIADFIINWYDLAEPDTDLLKKAGITVSNTSLTPEDIKECMESVAESAVFAGEALDDDKIKERAYDCLKEMTFPVFSDSYSDFASSFISCIEKWCFYASEITCLRSKRVGRFISNKDVLYTVLPKEAVDAVAFLIRAVFRPLYVYYDELQYEWLNEAGEYCSVFCLGDSENSVEDCLYGIHKRPYADIAVSLLDRLLTEAESLAPDILCDAKMPADAA